MCTAKNAAKIPALRHNPAVALTIDTEEHPPRILLIRGQAELDVAADERQRVGASPPARLIGVAELKGRRQMPLLVAI